LPLILSVSGLGRGATISAECDNATQPIPNARGTAFIVRSLHAPNLSSHDEYAVEVGVFEEMFLSLAKLYRSFVKRRRSESIAPVEWASMTEARTGRYECQTTYQPATAIGLAGVCAGFVAAACEAAFDFCVGACGTKP
jgi:hypothetical protein